MIPTKDYYDLVYGDDGRFREDEFYQLKKEENMAKKKAKAKKKKTKKIKAKK